MKTISRPFTVVALVAVCLAFLPTHSYGFFLALRWIVTIASVIHLVNFAADKASYFMIVSLLLVVLFIPLFKISFSRDTWLIIDGITAIWFTFLLAAKKC